MEYFVKFNPDFLIEVAKEYVQHCGVDPTGAGKILIANIVELSNVHRKADATQEIASAQKLLEIISKAVPGQLECLYLLARTRYLSLFPFI